MKTFEMDDKAKMPKCVKVFIVHTEYFHCGCYYAINSNSWNPIETKWYLVPSSIDTKDSIFKRKFQFKQKIFHCSKKFEMAKSRESSFFGRSISYLHLTSHKNSKRKYEIDSPKFWRGATLIYWTWVNSSCFFTHIFQCFWS